MSVDMHLGYSKIQIKRNGLFIIQQVNFRTMGILREMVDQIVIQLLRVRNTSQKFNVGRVIPNFGNPLGGKKDIILLTKHASQP